MTSAEAQGHCERPEQLRQTCPPREGRPGLLSPREARALLGPCYAMMLTNELRKGLPAAAGFFE